MKSTLAIAFLLFFTTYSFGQPIKYVNTEELNIREGAGTKFNIIGKAKNGSEVKILQEEGTWSEIETEYGIKGFVSTKFLSDSKGKDEPQTLDESSWVSDIIVIGIVGWILFKFLAYLFGIFNINLGLSSKKSYPTYYKSPVSSDKNTSYHEHTIDISESKVQSHKSPDRNYYCKCCGEKFNDIRALSLFTCHKSDTGKHQLFEGEEGTKYVCKCCGTEYKSIRNLTLDTCHKSPSKKHQPYEGTLKSEYACKFCGSKYRSIKSLTLDTCHKSPSMKHHPAK